MRMAITDSVPLAASMLLVTVALASCAAAAASAASASGPGVASSLSVWPSSGSAGWPVGSDSPSAASDIVAAAGVPALAAASAAERTRRPELAPTWCATVTTSLRAEERRTNANDDRAGRLAGRRREPRGEGERGRDSVMFGFTFHTARRQGSGERGAA